MSKSKKVVEKKELAVEAVEVVPVEESAPAVELTPVVESVPTVEFDVWFALREKRIPSQHLREIIWADFRGQGLSKYATMAAYDEALTKYGVKL